MWTSWVIQKRAGDPLGAEDLKISVRSSNGRLLVISGPFASTWPTCCQTC